MSERIAFGNVPSFAIARDARFVPAPIAGEPLCGTPEEFRFVFVKVECESFPSELCHCAKPLQNPLLGH
jgi:hypothetical protein